MKKLSVIAMVAMTALASTSCISFDEDEIPGTPEEYGYIKLSASADDVMVTRGEQTADLSKWYATVKKGETVVYGSDTKKALISSELEQKKLIPGEDYTVSVANYADNEEWVKANNNYGDAYYEGEITSVKVEAGKQTQVSIPCGRAKNAKFVVNASDFAGEELEVKVTNSRELTFSKADGTIGNEAFFTAGDKLKYEITYSIGAQKNKKIENKELQLGEAATVSTLTISSDQNGTIKVTITYDDTFDTGKNEEIEIDSATGDEKQD